jgi:predicted lipoprotein with Yx(FWY)xxD motif
VSRNTASRNRLWIAVLGALAAIGIAALSVEASTAGAAKPKPTKIGLSRTDHGKILVNGSGFVVYAFTHDKKKKDTCVKIRDCTGTWPVLKTHGKPLAGKGVKASLLGTITLAHNVKQVTYAGHPLYMYAMAAGPGDTSYIGTPEFGGNWDAVNAAGKLVH